MLRCSRGEPRCRRAEWEGVSPVSQDFLLVEILECPVARAMEGNDDSHHFAEAQPGLIAFWLAVARESSNLNPYRTHVNMALHPTPDLNR